MNTILDILTTILPILLAIGIGIACRKTQAVSQKTIDELRGMISTFIIPVVIFKAFYLIQFDRPTVTIVAAMLIILVCALLLGYPIRRFFGESGGIVPFLCTSYEGGMLGYAMFAMVMGQDNTRYYACADLGTTLFTFTILLMLMLSHNTGSASVKNCWDIARKNPAFWAVVIGLILGVSGAGTQIAASAAGTLVDTTLNFLTEPVGMLVLIIIGYNFQLDPAVNRLALRMLGCRYGIQGLLALIGFPILYALHALNVYTTAALALQFLLPPSFMVSVYLDTKGKTTSFLSIFLSINTVVGILLFLLIKVFVL
jgi:hypothetical protein